MGNEKQVVKGGFRSTLALIVSIIALIFSVLSYNQIGSQKDLNRELKSLQKKLQELTAETSEKLEKVKAETGEALQKIGKAVKKDE